MKLGLWILGATLALQALLLFGGLLPARICEAWHGRTVFPLLRALIGTPSSWIPFSVAQLLLALTVGLAVATVFELGLRIFGRVETLRLLPILGLVLFVGGHSFFLGYGWLHARPTIAARLDLPAPEDGATPRAALAIAGEARALASAGSASEWDWDELGARAHEAVRRACGELEIAAPPPFPLKHPWNARFLMQFRVSGVFAPFTFEPHVDHGLHPALLPFVACHELAHVAGIASESEANFLAWLACRRSPDPRFRLAAALGVLPHFEADLAGSEKQSVLQAQGADVLGLRRAIAERFRKSESPRMARISRVTYDGLLKIHGEKSGVRSYGLVTRLATVWLEREDR